MFRSITILVLIGFCFRPFAQDSDTLSYADQLAALELEMDSLSIFNLIDSLFDIDATAVSNEFNVRMSYTTSVTSAGRDYNLDQTGIAGGVSYYSKSGFYGDLSGYWNSGVTPNYNPTVIALGYLGSKGTKWSYSFDYEKWFFNPQDSSDNLLTNSMGTSLSYDFKIGYVSVDYSYLFGNANAHRFIGNLTGTIQLGKWWVFKSVSLYPTANIMYGNADITQLRITQEQISDEYRAQLQRLIELSQLTRQQRIQLWRSVQTAFAEGEITERQRNQYRDFLINSSQLTDEDIAEFQTLIDEGYENSEFIDGNQFGLMNYAFTIPLSLSTDRWNFLLSYTYSIPVKLPDEFFAVDPIGYFGLSVSYRIPLR
ncbi:MAG: hypothetical protein AAF391_08860 [Bacteroidota bacterium]